jgi:hypothetical protein
MIIINAAKVVHPTAQPLVGRSVMSPPVLADADYQLAVSKVIRPIWVIGVKRSR